jgi:carbamoyl-phosphate synthase large subunit
MNPTVLVPGAGGAAAISTIKALRLAAFSGRIISTDASALSPGFWLSDAHRVVPRADDPAFFPAIRQLIQDERIGVLLPTSGFDIYEYSRRRPELEALGAVVVVSDPDAMATCASKWEFYLKTRDAFPVPETSVDVAGWTRFPCFAKPIHGKGSRHSYRCQNREELMFYSRFAAMVVQEYLPGEEYTVDVLSDLSGTPLFAVPRVRVETKEGISTKGKVLKDKEIEDLCLEMAGFLRLKGPTCMQLKRDAAGALRFLEINPRIGGGSMFTTLAGANIPKLLLDLIGGARIAIPAWKEITVLRYYEEIVLDGHTI